MTDASVFAATSPRGSTHGARQATTSCPVPGVDRTLEAALAALLERQQGDGWWMGEDEANQTLDAQYIFLLYLTGLIERPHWQDKARRLAAWIRRTQREDGTWPIYFGGPSCISVTTECYTALKLLGDDPEAPHMARARAFIRAQGGPARARILTKFQLAFLGQYDWDCLPTLPVQLILAPQVRPFNIYELSYWARVCTVPLMIVADRRFSVPMPPGRDVAELFPAPLERDDLYRKAEGKRLVSWEKLFVAADRVLKRAERWNVRPLRELALRRAEQWVRDHQDEAGDWGGIFPAIANSLLALFVRGVSVDDPVFRRGLDALERFEWPNPCTDRSAASPAHPDETHIGPCVSPVWDTAWTVLALVEGGLDPEHEAVRSAARWLASRQIRRKGDWAVKAPHVPAGGWCFQFYNDFYPDTDDSAVVVMALTNGGDAVPDRKAVFDRALGWLLGMQNADGGWGAFELEVNEEVYDKILYNDEKNMLDPSSVDVTGRLLEMLGHLGVERDDPVVQRAEAYIRREQEPDGKWWGRWGVNYVYGTWSVLRGLAAVGVPTDDPAVVRAADWLESYQQDDGGWGESCASYLPGREAERCPSTASQTAWAVLGLIAAGRADSASARRGVEWLVERQQRDGLWYEDEFTGTGFPNAFYLRYHMYPCYFPVLALGAYRNALGGE